LYEKDGEKYFVVDGHVHYWDARPENRNKYGAGFINCFYDYHKNLSPEEYCGRRRSTTSTPKRT